MGKKAFFEALLENGPGNDVQALIAPATPGCTVPSTRALCALCLTGIEGRLVTFAGISGTLEVGNQRSYVLIPWRAVLWMGRDFGTKAAMGLSWEEAINDDGTPATSPRQLSAIARGHALGWRVIEGGKQDASRNREPARG